MIATAAAEQRRTDGPGRWQGAQWPGRSPRAPLTALDNHGTERADAK